MQFSYITVISFLAAVASSAPAPAAQTTTVLSASELMSDFQAQGVSTLSLLADAGCDKLKCIASLAGQTAACGVAAAQLGLNPLADLSCFASVGTAIAVDSCAGCF